MKVTFDTSNPKLAGAFGITSERQDELANLNDEFLRAESEKPDFNFGQCIVAALDRANTVEEVGFLMYVQALSKDAIEQLMQLNHLKAQMGLGGDHDN